MNTAVNEYNYRFKLTDYSLFDRNRARKVAIYGRVSTEHEAQLSALENQLQWYDDQVKYHPNWTVCERYIDEGITGTQAKKRPAFLKMIEDAKQGKFDLIVTREVCRFARNVVDTLVVTRELKGIGVEVFFIDDNIWTMDGDGELRLSLMATLAQEESRKTSERVKWGQKRQMEQGIVFGRSMLGYDVKDGKMTINEEGAKIVRLIFHKFVDEGKGTHVIARELREEGIEPMRVKEWQNTVILRVIRNEKYCGDVLLQKTFRTDVISKKVIKNVGQMTQYYMPDHHEGIVSREQYNAVKAEMARRSALRLSLIHI